MPHRFLIKSKYCVVKTHLHRTKVKKKNAKPKTIAKMAKNEIQITINVRCSCIYEAPQLNIHKHVSTYYMNVSRKKMFLFYFSPSIVRIMEMIKSTE